MASRLRRESKTLGSGGGERGPRRWLRRGSIPPPLRSFDHRRRGAGFPLEKQQGEQETWRKWLVWAEVVSHRDRISDSPGALAASLGPREQTELGEAGSSGRLLTAGSAALQHGCGSLWPGFPAPPASPHHHWRGWGVSVFTTPLLSQI